MYIVDHAEDGHVKKTRIAPPDPLGDLPWNGDGNSGAPSHKYTIEIYAVDNGHIVRRRDYDFVNQRNVIHDRIVPEGGSVFDEIKYLVAMQRMESA